MPQAIACFEIVQQEALQQPGGISLLTLAGSAPIILIDATYQTHYESHLRIRLKECQVAPNNWPR